MWVSCHLISVKPINIPFNGRNEYCQTSAARSGYKFDCTLHQATSKYESKEGSAKKNTVNACGDITSGAFTFPQVIWCTLIPRIIRISNDCFRSVFIGGDWKQFINKSVFVADWVSLDVSVQKEGTVFPIEELKLNEDVNVSIGIMHSVVELCLFGLGVGAVRHEEIMRLKIASSQWHHDYLYYWTTSLKEGSMRRNNTKPKTVEHRLPISLSKVFLLIRYAISKALPTNSNNLFPIVPQGNESETGKKSW